VANVPFTPGHEIKQLRQKLLASLLEWKETHFDYVSKEVLLLYHLCRLHSLVPSLRSLFRVSGYLKPTLGFFDEPKELERILQAVSEYSVASSTAWGMLETSEALPSEQLPIWAPLSLFSAGLVIWAHTAFTGVDGVLDSFPARAVRPFQEELARIKLSGAREMSTILAALGQRHLRNIKRD
jgi:hypothetical protein